MECGGHAAAFSVPHARAIEKAAATAAALQTR